MIRFEGRVWLTSSEAAADLGISMRRFYSTSYSQCWPCRQIVGKDTYYEVGFIKAKRGCVPVVAATFPLNLAKLVKRAQDEVNNGKRG